MAFCGVCGVTCERLHSLTHYTRNLFSRLSSDIKSFKAVPWGLEKSGNKVYYWKMLFFRYHLEHWIFQVWFLHQVTLQLGIF